MGAIDRYRANPYRIKAVASRLLSGRRRKKTVQKIKKWYFNLKELPLNIVSNVADHFRSRLCPRFYWENKDIDSIISLVPEAKKNELIENANGFINGKYSFRGCEPVTFSGSLDWKFQLKGFPEWNRDLHRLDWLVRVLIGAHFTGENAFYEFASEQIIDWHKANPPDSAAWLDPFEVAQRINTLCWILYLGRQNAAFSNEAIESAIASIFASAQLTGNLLEYHSPNNHLFIEALRLAQAGLLFPEIPLARNWLFTGHTLLLREVKRQILPDGVHAERSLFYHRLILEALLEWVILAKVNGHYFSQIFDDRCIAMISFLSAIRRPDGEFPQFGDGFRDDTFLRFDPFAIAAAELNHQVRNSTPDAHTPWILAGKWPVEKNIKRLPHGNLFEDGGFAVIGEKENDGSNHFVFDCGPFGMKAAPSHGHAGCLSFEWFTQNRPMLVNSGTYSFASDLAVRNAFRGTAAHNTILVDGKDQTELESTFGAGHFEKPSVNLALFGNRHSVLEAEHYNYQRLTGNIVHRRSIVELVPSTRIIIDRITGSGKHETKAHWHFHPDLKTKVSDSGCTVIDENNRGISISWFGSTAIKPGILRGKESPMIGWVSFDAGTKVEADVLALTADSELPIIFVTVMHSFSKDPVAPDFTVNFDDQKVMIAAEDSELRSEILSSHSKESLSTETLQCNAAFCMLVEHKDNLCMAIANGNEMRRKGSPLFELDSDSKGLLMEQHGSFLSITGESGDRLRYYDPSIEIVSVNGRIVRIEKSEEYVEVLNRI